MLDRGKALQIHTDLADDLQRGAGVDARYAREVHAAGLEQRCARIEAHAVPGRRATLGGAQAVVGQFVRLERTEQSLQFGVALRDLACVGVDQGQRLLARKQVLVAPVALQRRSPSKGLAVCLKKRLFLAKPLEREY